MKKLLTILILLLAVASQGSAVETTLWESTYTDGIELNSEKVATFKAGDVLRVYVTVPGNGANFKIVYKGAPDWSETTIPSINNQWPWVNGNETYKEFILTENDLTAINGKNIYIYKGDNSTITKVVHIKCFTLSTSATNGSITVKNGETDVTGTSSFQEGTELSLTPNPDEGYIFEKWTIGGSESTAKSLSVTMSADQTVTASFKDAKILDWGHEYSTGTTGLTDIRVNDRIKIVFTGESTLSSTDEIQIFHKDAEWHGTQISSGTLTEKVYEFTVTETMCTNIKERGLYIKGENATFQELQVEKYYSVTITEPSNGTITVKKGSNVVSSGDYVPINTSLTLTAAGTTGYEFDKWTSPASLSTESASTSLTVIEDVTIAADFKSAKSLQTLSTGSKWIVENGGVSVGGSSLTDIAVGDVLTVNVSNVSTGAQYQLKYAGGNWDTFQNATDLAANATSFSYTIPDATVLSNIKTNGIFITGNGYTCGNIQIETAATISSDATHSDPTLTISTPENGTISVKIGEFSVNSGDKVGEKKTLTLKAEPADGYQFSKWTSPASLESATAETSVEMTSGDMTISAEFEAIPETVTALTTGESRTLFENAEGSAITWNEVCDTKNSAWGSILAAGDQIVVTVSEKTGTSNTKVVLRDGSSNAVGSDISIDGVESFPYEAIYTLTSENVTALASGFCISGDGIKVTKVALRRPATYTLTITAPSNGSFTVNDGTSALETGASVKQWTKLTLNANASADYSFSKWTVNGTEYTDNPYTFEMSGNTTVSATFTIVPVGTPLFDENGKADLSKFEVQDAEKVTYDTESHKITVTEGWTGVQVTATSADAVQGKEVRITFAEAAKVKATVKYADETATDTIMSGAATILYMVIDGTKKVSQIQIQPTEVGSVTLSEVKVNAESTKPADPVIAPVFTDGVADLSKFEVQDAEKVTYDTESHKITVTEGWTGVQVTATSADDVQGKEVRITFSEAAKVKATVKYADETATDTIMSGAATILYMVINGTKKVSQIQIQPTEVGSVTLSEVKVNAESTKPSEPINPDTPSQTGVNISLDNLNEGWNSTYDVETNTIDITSDWGARGWYIGDDRYNSKGSVTVRFKKVDFPVTLKMEFTNTAGENKSVSAGAATGETEVTVDIPTDIKTMDMVYVTFEKAGKLVLTDATVNDKVVDNRTERTLVEKSQAITDGDIEINRGLFSNAVAGDILRIYAKDLSDASKIALEPAGYSGALDGANWAGFSESPFTLKLTTSLLKKVQAQNLLVRGENYTFLKASLYTEADLGDVISGDGEDDISNDASEEAKKVYNVLKDLYGNKIVSGVVANVDWNTKEAENVYGWTGKYPAMNVFDFINLHASKDVNSAGWVDYSDITTAKNWWKEGGIVGAMWHWQVKANNGTDYTCTPGTAAGETSFDASKVYVEGTPENTLAKQQLDQLCGYLKKMQDAGIPVVWRPLHEASGNVEQYSGGKAWFWWGAKGADVYKQLWQWMYNYMVKTKGLNNLIWVWTSQTKDHNWYPGDAYVDIIGRDNYGATAASLAEEYETQKGAYPNKMITLSECGNSETTEMAKLSSIWDAGSRWSWFMTWYDGDYNDGKTTTHKHTSEAWWEDAVSKDYVITRDKMKELLGQESSDDSKTGVNISLDDLNEGWSSSYNATTKTITTEGEWAARGWYIGDNRYNDKGSITVKFNAVEHAVTLKMEYTNANDEAKDVSAGAAAGETEITLDIPANAKTIDKVYITFEPTGTLTLTEATVNDKVVDNRTEKTLVEKTQAIADGDIEINRGLFSNAVAGDEIRIYADGLSESSKLALEPGDYSGAFDGANWTGFTESPFKLKLTATLIATIKEKGLLIRGESFTFKKAVLYTEKELGSEISDDEKKDDEKKDDEEAIIDKKTGEADLNELSAQDDTKTTLTQNEDGSITMTTTEAYQAAQIWFNDPEVVAGNVLKVQLAESSVNVTVTVKYTDGTQSQMSANTMAAKARGAVRAATRADSGTEIEVPLETGKEVQNIEVKNNVAGTITIQKMQVTTINVFTNGVANLSMLKPQSNATYDTSTHTLATTKGWTGATISPVDGETVSGKELLIEFAEAAKVKVAVKYRTDVEGPSIIMEKAAANVRLALDNTKNIQEISIQPTDAAIVTFTKIAVNGEESDDGKLKPGKSITLWENSAGEKLAWNEVAKQGEDIGEMLQEYDELLITVSGVAEDCDWPKVFLRDANSEQVGNEVLLNDVASFPYTVRIVLTGDMAEQLANGFCVCGDGITVTKLVAYRPEEPKEGDIHLADLNYGYNSSYDKGTHTITTTSRWAARGWEIGDKRYNDKNLIIVKFEPVDFPVTLKMEYTTGVQTAQATSVGVPAGRTELMLEIPQGISKLNRVYLIYEEPGSLRLTEASVVYQDKLKLSTAIQAFEAEGVIRDGRYDTDGWYNLRGMRIQEPKTSGVYIHGGKKVVIY